MNRKFYAEDCTDKNSNNRLVLVIAINKHEANKIYYDCLRRHKELKPKDNPTLIEIWNTKNMLDEISTKDNLCELEKYDSTVL